MPGSRSLKLLTLECNSLHQLNWKFVLGHLRLTKIIHFKNQSQSKHPTTAVHLTMFGMW